MALYQFNGETASALYLDGRLLKTFKELPLKMIYTTSNPEYTHTFNANFKYTMDRIDNGNGTFTIKIFSKNDFNSFRCNINTLSIDFMVLTSNVTNMNHMFDGCENLTSVNLSSFDTSNVTSMSYMFNNCSSLTSLDLSNFNTSKVTYKQYMFTNVPATADWHYDGSNYADWDLTEEDTGYSGTFPWNITYTVTVNYIDDNNIKIIDPYIITVKNKQKYDIELETNRKFKGYAHLEVQGELSGVATGNVIINDLYTNFNYVEYKINNSDYLSERTINYKGTYSDSSDNPGKEYYYFLPQPDESSNGWQYALLTLSDGTTTTDLSTPVHKVERVRVYFYNNTTYFRFNCIHSKITEIIYMYTENFTTFEDMFKNSYSITKVDLTGWKTENVTSMKNMFYNCDELSQVVGLEGLDVKNLTDTSYMFYKCEELTGSLNFSWTNADKIRNVEYMFYKCSKLTSLNLSNFNTSNVTNMRYMFYRCESLTSLDLSNFNTSKVTNMYSMLLSIPVTVDWHYDGTNYANWTLTEEQTDFSGTFPWNQ